MKKISVLISALLMTFSAMAQTNDSIDVSKFTVGYYFTTNTTDKDGNAVCDSLSTVLLIGSKMTKTMGYYTHTYKILNVDKREYYDEYQREGMAHVPTIFVSLADKNMEVHEDVPPYHYTYQESGDLQWTLLDDTLTITGYLCHKAQTTYGGRTWYAYYAEDIPSSAGPWKLHGLPGLIVKAEDAEGIFCFEMFELTQQSVAITNLVDATINKTKRDKFIQMRNKLFLDKRYMEDPRYYWSTTEISGVYEFYGTYEDLMKRTGGVILMSECTYKVNGIAVPRFEETRLYYQPLELK